MKMSLLILCGLALLACGCSRERLAEPVAQAWYQGGVLLGEAILEKTNSPDVLVLVNPLAELKNQPPQARSMQEAALRGLAKTLGKGISVEVFAPPLKTTRAHEVVPPGATTPLSYMVEADTLRLASEYRPQANVIVSLIGLPLDCDKTPEWQRSNAPKLALLFPDWNVLRDPREGLRALRSGRILAAVEKSPGADGSPRLIQP